MHAAQIEATMRPQRTIYITDQDMIRLKDLLTRAKEENPFRADLRDLEAELVRGRQVAATAVPSDVITMHSTVRLLDQDSQEELVYTLVFPTNADIRHGKISVLAPVGTALLGHQVGDIVHWQVPDGLVRLEVKALLYQPEAAGDYDL